MMISNNIRGLLHLQKVDDSRVEMTEKKAYFYAGVAAQALAAAALCVVVGTELPLSTTVVSISVPILTALSVGAVFAAITAAAGWLPALITSAVCFTVIILTGQIISSTFITLYTASALTGIFNAVAPLDQPRDLRDSVWDFVSTTPMQIVGTSIMLAISFWTCFEAGTALAHHKKVIDVSTWPTLCQPYWHAYDQ